MSADTIFITTGKPIFFAALAASPGDVATRSLGSAIPYALRRALESCSERLSPLGRRTPRGASTGSAVRRAGDGRNAGRVKAD